MIFIGIQQVSFPNFPSLFFSFFFGLGGVLTNVVAGREGEGRLGIQSADLTTFIEKKFLSLHSFLPTLLSLQFWPTFGILTVGFFWFPARRFGGRLTTADLKHNLHSSSIHTHIPRHATNTIITTTNSPLSSRHRVLFNPYSNRQAATPGRRRSQRS